MAKMQSVTINASMIEDTDEAEDFLAERGIDIELPADFINHREVMALLFEGFADRLKAAGIECGSMTNFT